MGLADEKESCAVKFRYLFSCTKLAHIRQISASSANKATDEYRKFLQSVLPRYQLEFTEFDKYKDSVDSFLYRFLSDEEYSNLFHVAQLVFIMFHGQAHIERGFKTNSDMLRDNLQEFSLVSLRTVHYYMSAKSCEPHNVPFTHEMVKHCKKARGRYQIHLDEQAQKKKLNATELKRKV